MQYASTWFKHQSTTISDWKNAIFLIHVHAFQPFNAFKNCFITVEDNFFLLLFIFLLRVVVVVVCVYVCAVLLILSLLFVLERTVIYIFYNMNRNIPFPGTSSSHSGCDVLPVWACAVLPGGCSPDDRWPSWEREHPGKGPVELPSSAWIARFGDPIDWLQRESETKRDPESSYRINFLNQQTDSMYSSAN